VYENEYVNANGICSHAIFYSSLLSIVEVVMVIVVSMFMFSFIEAVRCTSIVDFDWVDLNS